MKRKVSIVGGGTAGLFCAAFLDTHLFDVTIFEKMSTLGRKFLVAGDGGFNLTHNEEISAVKKRYHPATYFDEVLDHFTNTDLRAWLLDIDIPTYVGSSGRIFPDKGIKPINVLKCILTYLEEKNVKFVFNKTFTGWHDNDSLVFNSNDIIQSDYIIFALGGASWKVTGSDGSWLTLFNDKKVRIQPFRSSNCAFRILWEESFIQKYKGTPLKNIAISLNDQSQKGEVVITNYGIEGNAIYALSHNIQSALAADQKAVIFMDFKPHSTISTIVEKIDKSTLNTTVALREKVRLSKAQIALIKSTLTKEEFLDIDTLARYIKSFPFTIVDSAPIDEAISTIGGIDLRAIDSNFELVNMKRQFCIGEMLDWNAPTGGYLIQACASTGAYVANHLNHRNKGNLSELEA